MLSQLDILAGTIRRGNLTGRVLVNGRPMQPAHFRKLNCYILQRDVLLATATVGTEAEKIKGLLQSTLSWSKWLLPGAVAACNVYLPCSTFNPHNIFSVVPRGRNPQLLLCPSLTHSALHGCSGAGGADHGSASDAAPECAISHQGGCRRPDPAGAGGSLCIAAVHFGSKFCPGSQKGSLADARASIDDF